VRTAGTVPDNNNFVCILECQSGQSAAGGNASITTPPPGVFSPPYAINNNNTQLSINTKVLLLTFRDLIPSGGSGLSGCSSWLLHAI
jgi:hypothetical protein